MLIIQVSVCQNKINFQINQSMNYLMENQFQSFSERPCLNSPVLQIMHFPCMASLCSGNQKYVFSSHPEDRRRPLLSDHLQPVVYMGKPWVHIPRICILPLSANIPAIRSYNQNKKYTEMETGRVFHWISHKTTPAVRSRRLYHHLS